MAEMLDFRTVPGKDARFHFELARKVLIHVHDERPSQRRFAMWLREAGISDKPLLQFLVKLLDVKIGARAELGEVGEDLYQAAIKPPPRPVMTVAGPGQRAPAEQPPPPPDPFKKALFERFVELAGYMIKYVYTEIADAGGYLSEAEMYQRVQRSGFAAARPTKEQFDRWLKWMQFLGHIQQVGFRMRHTEAGVDGLGYLKSLSDEDLMGGQGAMGLLSGLTDDEPEAEADTGGLPAKAYLTAADLGTDGEPDRPLPVLPEAAPPRGGRAPAGRGSDDLDDELDDVDFGPGAQGPASDDDEDDGAYGAVAAGSPSLGAPARERLDEAKPLSADEADAIRELFGDSALEDLEPRGDGIEQDALGARLAALGAELGDLTSDDSDAGDGGGDRGGDGDGDGDGGAIALAPDPLDDTATTAVDLIADEPTDAADETSTAADDTDAAIDEAEGEDEAEDEETDADASGDAAPKAAPPPAPEATQPLPAVITRPAPPARAPAGAAAPARPSAAPARPAVFPTSALVATLWECAPGRQPLTFAALGLARAQANPKTLGFDLFRLAVAAALCEGRGSFAEKLALYGRLARAKALESIFFLDWTIDRALEAADLMDPRRPLPDAAERLVHLPRLKRALADAEAVGSLSKLAPDLRAARLGALAGGALGQGAFWVAREMTRLGHW